MKEKQQVHLHPMRVIAHIRSPFPTKFGIPRQSGLAAVQARIVMEPPYRNPDAFRGLSDFSHLWLIWQFSEAVREGWSPTVRPPRLGGNTRMGVFATRSPFRPNPIGLSSVKIESIDLHTKDGPVITVSGADLMDGTPIYDIKPYLSYTDSHPDALCGFADPVREDRLSVILPEDEESKLDSSVKDALISLLKGDPRPSYQDDPDREYGFLFEQYEVRFRVSDDVLTVLSIEEMKKRTSP